MDYAKRFLDEYKDSSLKKIRITKSDVKYIQSKINDYDKTHIVIQKRDYCKMVVNENGTLFAGKTYREVLIFLLGYLAMIEKR